MKEFVCLVLRLRNGHVLRKGPLCLYGILSPALHLHETGFCKTPAECLGMPDEYDTQCTPIAAAQVCPFPFTSSPGSWTLLKKHRRSG